MSILQKFVQKILLSIILLKVYQQFFLITYFLSLVIFVTMMRTKCHNGLKCTHPECDYQGTKFGLQQHFGRYPKCHKFFTMDTKTFAKKAAFTSYKSKLSFVKEQVITSIFNTSNDKISKMEIYFEDDGFGNMVASDSHGNDLEVANNEFLEQSNYDNEANDDNEIIILDDANEEKFIHTIPHQYIKTNLNHCSQPLKHTFLNDDNPTLIYKQFCYLKSDVHELKLLQILLKHNVPHDLHKDIVDWAREAYNDGYKFNPK